MSQENIVRKIHLVGGYTKFIALPKKWADACKSDKVRITEKDNLLIISRIDSNLLREEK